MATAQMPAEFFDSLAHHLPPEQPVGPKGGRPRVGHFHVVRALWLVPTTGSRWEDAPSELGCSGRSAHRGLWAREEAGIWDRFHADLPRLLKKAGKLDLKTVNVDGVTMQAFGGGQATGPSPVDRRKSGSKHTVMVNKAGVPLVIHTVVANASDHTQILPVLLDFPKAAGPPGRRDAPMSYLIMPTPTEATTARPCGDCSTGWGSSRTSPGGTRSTAADWARSASFLSSKFVDKLP